MGKLCITPGTAPAPEKPANKTDEANQEGFLKLLDRTYFPK